MVDNRQMRATKAPSLSSSSMTSGKRSWDDAHDESADDEQELQRELEIIRELRRRRQYQSKDQQQAGKTGRREGKGDGEAKRRGLAVHALVTSGEITQEKKKQIMDLVPGSTRFLLDMDHPSRSINNPAAPATLTNKSADQNPGQATLATRRSPSPFVANPFVTRPGRRGHTQPSDLQVGSSTTVYNARTVHPPSIAAIDPTLLQAVGFAPARHRTSRSPSHTSDLDLPEHDVFPELRQEDADLETPSPPARPRVIRQDATQTAQHVADRSPSVENHRGRATSVADTPRGRRSTSARESDGYHDDRLGEQSIDDQGEASTRTVEDVEKKPIAATHYKAVAAQRIVDDPNAVRLKGNDRCTNCINSKTKRQCWAIAEPEQDDSEGEEDDHVHVNGRCAPCVRSGLKCVFNYHHRERGGRANSSAAPSEMWEVLNQINGYADLLIQMDAVGGDGMVKGIADTIKKKIQSLKDKSTPQ